MPRIQAAVYNRPSDVHSLIRPEEFERFMKDIPARKASSFGKCVASPYSILVPKCLENLWSRPLPFERDESARLIRASQRPS